MPDYRFDLLGAFVGGVLCMAGIAYLAWRKIDGGTEPQ